MDKILFEHVAENTRLIEGIPLRFSLREESAAYSYRVVGEHPDRVQSYVVAEGHIKLDPAEVVDEVKTALYVFRKMLVHPRITDTAVNSYELSCGSLEDAVNQVLNMRTNKKYITVNTLLQYKRLGLMLAALPLLTIEEQDD